MKIYQCSSWSYKEYSCSYFPANSVFQTKSNQTIYSVTWFYKFWYILTKIKWLNIYNEEIMCGETTCKETLYKPRAHNAKIKTKLKQIENK